MTAIRTWPSGTCGSRSCVTRTTSGPPVVVTTTARIARLPPTAASSIRACPRKRCHRSGPAQSSDNHGRHQPEQAAPERAAPFRSRGPICSRGCPMVRAVTPHPRGAATGDPASEHPSARRRTRRRTRAPLRAPTRIRRATGTPRHLQRPNRPRLANRASEPGHDVDAVVAEDARLRQARSNRDPRSVVTRGSVCPLVAAAGSDAGGGASTGAPPLRVVRQADRLRCSVL